jgi:ATP-binding cassette subfamily B multidrug efflux pump
MTRLAKYLKPYTALLLLVVLLLFVQATADLTLPDYMAHIVNNGIQQSGVDNPVAQALRQSQMDKLALFMSGDDVETVLSHYTLVDQNSAEYSHYLVIYPTVATEPIYVLNSLSAAELDIIKPILSKAFLIVSVIEKVMADPASLSNGQASGFDLSALPAGTDIFALLSNMPALLRAPILNNINTRFEAMGASMIEQAAVSAVKAEYAALGVDTVAMQNNYIANAGLMMLLWSLVSGASTIAVSYLSARAAAGMARTLRRDVFTKVESFSNNEFDKFSVSSLITRSTNDVTQLQTLIVIMVRMVVYAPILATGGIIKAMNTDSSMWWTIALAVVALLSLIFSIFTIALPKFKIIQQLVDRLNLVSRENLTGMMVVRAFNTQKFEENRFDKANLELTETNLFVNRVMVFMMPAMMLIMNGVTILIIWVGAHQVADSQMQVGSMIAFMQYAIQIVMSFLMLSFMFIILPRASVSADRVADVLEIVPVIQDPKTPKHFNSPFKGLIEFRDVSFRYHDAEEDVLSHISFTAKPGETTAFIGATGSGKSTLINLLPRFYDVTQGEILFDGVDIREVTQAELRDKIGYIPQKGNLFSGTIESNLRYADETVTEDAVRLATDIAQATAFIGEMPNGLSAEIAQGGTNVSGGQRQRLSIARALVKKPQIYIFDDSFSALDFKTDVMLRKALKQHTGGSTLLIVAQRIATIMSAEQIIVLDEGRIVGKGSHDELMETNETYREIALSQLSAKELA